MSNDTTTIEITSEQRERLRSVNSGSAKAAVDDLLDGHEVDVPDDLREQLDRIESAASTAEERTGTIERKVDNLKP